MSWNNDIAQPTGAVEATRPDGQLETEAQGQILHKNADSSNPNIHVASDINDDNRASEINNLDGGNSTENVDHAEKKTPSSAELGEKRERDDGVAETQAEENGEEPAKKAKVNEEDKEEKPTKRVTRARKAASAKKVAVAEPAPGATKKRGPGRPRKNQPPPAPEPVSEPAAATGPPADEIQNGEQKAMEVKPADGEFEPTEPVNPVPAEAALPLV